jgi:hypothetical protein
MYLITECVPDGADTLLVLYDQKHYARAEVLYDPEHDAVACLTCGDPHCAHAESVRALLDLPGQHPTARAARLANPTAGPRHVPVVAPDAPPVGAGSRI